MSTPGSDYICTQARLLLDLDRPHEAVDLLGGNLAFDPNNPELLGLLGSAYINMGDSEKGRTYTANALSLAPDVPWLLVNLAIATTGKNIREARSLAKRAILVDPGYVVAYLLLVDLLATNSLINRGQITRLLDKAKELEPMNPEVWTTSGRFNELIRRRSTAHREYLEALRIQPDNGDALMGLSRTETSVVHQTEMARRAGRGLLGDSRPMSELEHHARSRLVGATLVWFTPVAFAMGVAAGASLGYGWGVLAMTLTWVAAGAAVPLRLRSHIARRWAQGQHTWWLADRAIAANKPKRLNRTRKLVWGVTFAFIYFTTMVFIGAAVGIPPAEPPRAPEMVLSEDPYVLRLPDGQTIEQRVMIDRLDPPRRPFDVTLPDGTVAKAQVDTSPSYSGTIVYFAAMMGVVLGVRQYARRRERILR